MLSVRIAAALARTLPRRAGLVSIFEFSVFDLCRLLSENPDFIHMKRHDGVVPACTRICTGGHRALHRS